MESKEQLINDLTEIVKPYVQNQEAFESMDEDTDFIRDLNINSANLVDVVLDIEDKYEIDIDNESMERMLDVKSSLAIIQEKMAAK